jgi:hypothetical protein
MSLVDLDHCLVRARDLEQSCRVDCGGPDPGQ